MRNIFFFNRTNNCVNEKNCAIRLSAFPVFAEMRVIKNIEIQAVLTKPNEIAERRKTGTSDYQGGSLRSSQQNGKGTRKSLAWRSSSTTTAEPADLQQCD